MTIAKNGVRSEVVETISLLVARIPWPERHQAIQLRILDEKPRIAEDIFSWGRSTVELEMNELRTGIVCKNDLSNSRCPYLFSKPDFFILSSDRLYLSPKAIPVADLHPLRILP